MRTISIAALAALFVTTVQADDWTASRLRGGVFVLNAGQWVQLQRGSVVSDDSVIKSAPGSRASFVRGAETVEIGADTTIQIADGSSGFTTVYNHEGTVGIDAEVRNVQHFAVQTHYLAAVVKGTAFTVRAGADHATVAVARGRVEVNDARYQSSVSLSAGEEVSSTKAGPITVSDIVPVSPDMPAPPARGAAKQAGKSDGSPGNSGNAPGRTGGSPGNSGNSSGHSGDSPGNSGHGSGKGGNSSGNSGNSGNSPGNSGSSSGNNGGGSGGSSGSSGGSGGSSGGGGGSSGGGGGSSGGSGGNSGGGGGNSGGGGGNSGGSGGSSGGSGGNSGGGGEGKSKGKDK
ncbi:MAG TPA: FecR family protein [Devosiaceae bacterium]|jgi:hypothetical protein|nr:FecR family protein [Devosiaceae bacterium]